MNVLDLFSGIGGFSLGLEWTGKYKTVAFCEIDEFCQKVLAKHWPDVPVFDDITTLTPELLSEHGIGDIDVITAGFPCQPFSNAGRQKGKDDERYLWPELASIIRMVRPKYVILENVSGLLTINGGKEFGLILSTLVESGYDAEWQLLPASAFGAPHIRERLWIVAYSAGVRHPKSGVFRKDTISDSANASWKTTDAINAIRRGELPALCREYDGVSRRVDRLRSLGNAVVPQVVQWIGEQVAEHHEKTLIKGV